MSIDEVAEAVHFSAATNASDTVRDRESLAWVEAYLATVDVMLDELTTERGAASYDVPRALTSEERAEIRRRLREPYRRDIPMPDALERNPARTLGELPDDVRIGVVESFDEGEDRILQFSVYYADERGHPLPSSRDSIDDPEPEQFFSGVVRAFYRASCDAYEVVYSIAAPGWGPLLYDTAIELASQYGGGLMSDRHSVSDAACRVWAMYRKRTDIGQRVLPDKRQCKPQDECSTEIAFTKVPDNLLRLESERKILYFDDVPPGAQYIPLPAPEEALAKSRPLAANPDEEKIRRAATLLNFMEEQEAYEHLVGEGMPQDDAYLAVKAARIYVEDFAR